MDENVVQEMEVCKFCKGQPLENGDKCPVCNGTGKYVARIRFLKPPVFPISRWKIIMEGTVQMPDEKSG